MFGFRDAPRFAAGLLLGALSNGPENRHKKRRRTTHFFFFTCFPPVLETKNWRMRSRVTKRAIPFDAPTELDQVWSSRVQCSERESLGLISLFRGEQEGGLGKLQAKNTFWRDPFCFHPAGSSGLLKSLSSAFRLGFLG